MNEYRFDSAKNDKVQDVLPTHATQSK